MSIAFDAAADLGDNGGSTSSLTGSHTATGSNLIGVVGILGDNITGGNDDISGVTWGGAAMTLWDKFTTPDQNADRFTYLYYILAPATGSQSIVISAGSTHFLLANSATYTGAAQSGNPVEGTKNSVGGAFPTDLTTSLTTSVNNSWTVLLAQGAATGGGGAGAGTGATKRTEGVTYKNRALFDSNGAITPAGSYSMQTTYTSGGGGSVAGIIHVMASIKPYVGPPPIAVRTLTTRNAKNRASFY